MAEPRRTRALYHNTVSYFGGLVVAASLVLIVFALILEFSLGHPSPYLGIFTYMVFPSIFGAGALLFLFGMRRESLRRRRSDSLDEPPYPKLDLNDPVHRRRFAVSMVGGTLGAILLGFISYNAFLFSESVTFCGRICHTIMEPEYTAYQHSPHARVRCVECHVGSGASWYVKSKLSGVRQVFAAALKTYERPIPVPIQNLRPARETCEECHWPQKFYGAQLVQNPHFRYDEKNTPEQVSLLLKTGGGDPKLGAQAGIHWHMILANTVSFATDDPRQQVIPWVHVRRHDGSEETYVSLDAEEPAEALALKPRHTVDCIDCHNRPTHIYPAPETAVDQALASGLMSPDLPWIKKVAVDALVREYPDREAAHAGLRKEIAAFYETNYPGVDREKIRAAQEAVEAIYDRSVFPAMKVNWTTYADNIGHRNWPGCFRCHDGRHVARSGKAISMDCTLCHTLPQRGPRTPLGTLMPVSDAGWHPWELRGKHAQILCNRCHAAGFRAPTDCAECHKMDAGAPMMSMGCDTCHVRPQEVLPLADCRSCHEALKGLHTGGAHPDLSCAECHKPHTWKVSGREGCESCHEDKRAHYEKDGPCAGCHGFRG
ncbi:MAG: NapC/NirT family cytochrome c [Acidobacteriota bacterium]